jgi:hypothetical protein
MGSNGKPQWYAQSSKRRHVISVPLSSVIISGRVADSDGMPIASVTGSHHFKKHSRMIAGMIVDRVLESAAD